MSWLGTGTQCGGIKSVYGVIPPPPLHAQLVYGVIPPPPLHAKLVYGVNPPHPSMLGWYMEYFHPLHVKLVYGVIPPTPPLHA